MTAEDIAKLRGLLERATSGPWSLRGAIPANGTFTVDDGTDLGIVALHVDHGDAALICAAVNALPALLDEHERAMAVVRAVARGNLVDYSCGASRCALCGSDLRNEETDEHDHSKHAPGCAWVAARGMGEGSHD